MHVNYCTLTLTFGFTTDETDMPDGVWIFTGVSVRPISPWLSGILSARSNKIVKSLAEILLRVLTEPEQITVTAAGFIEVIVEFPETDLKLVTSKALDTTDVWIEIAT